MNGAAQRRCQSFQRRDTLSAMFRVSAFALLGLLCATGLAQGPSAPPPLPPSHEVHADGSITFRLLAPGAHKVELTSDAVAKPLPLTVDDAGLWSVTTQPLPPEIYGYTFTVDGRTTLDSRNPVVRSNIVNPSNEVLVPAAPAAPWELTGLAHGRLVKHVYTTHVAQNVPGDQESYVVYLPPGYDARKKGGYPVLYLLHGWSDDATGWSSVGRANLILDSLLAANKAVPMIIVMPLGYGDYTFVTGPFSVWQHPEPVDHNTSLYEQMLMTEILPAVERDYNVAKGRENRAISGLSMGGLETLTVGLHHPEMFAYVAGMSSAIHGEHFDEHFPTLAAGDAARKTNFKLLWVGCGTGDGLIKANRDFVVWAKSKGLPVVAVETPGQHTWLVWRDNLVTVAPLLFR